jgi:hypothetical protein
MIVKGTSNCRSALSIATFEAKCGTSRKCSALRQFVGNDPVEEIELVGSIERLFDGDRIEQVADDRFDPLR